MPALPPYSPPIDAHASASSPQRAPRYRYVGFAPGVGYSATAALRMGDHEAAVGHALRFSRTEVGISKDSRPSPEIREARARALRAERLASLSDGHLCPSIHKITDAPLASCPSCCANHGHEQTDPAGDAGRVQE